MDKIIFFKKLSNYIKNIIYFPNNIKRSLDMIVDINSKTKLIHNQYNELTAKTDFILNHLELLSSENNNLKQSFDTASANIGYLTNSIDSLKDNIIKQEEVIFKNIADHCDLLNIAKTLHSKSFRGYKNIYSGKDVVLVATGPTLNYYDPIDSAIHVGVNRAFMLDKINLDYIFMQDYNAVKDYIEEIVNYKNPEIKKFYGIAPSWCTIPESLAIRHEAIRYFINIAWSYNFKFNYTFAYDITTQLLSCYGSIVFPALQFILYTNPKRLYLVGCDCEDSGQFNDPNYITSDPTFTCVKNGWSYFKTFVEIYYPELEVISINPVGLKGLFNDVYT